MPHISIKMLKGRTEEQKKAAALVDTIGCNPEHISVSVEDFTPDAENKHLVIPPNYDPKDVLKK